MAAIALDATYVGAPLGSFKFKDISASAISSRSGVSQFRVDSDESLHVHGFAARDTPQGNADRAHIRDHVRSVLDGAPRIRPPRIHE